MSAFARRLESLDCKTQWQDEVLRVQIPAGQSQQVLWQAAAAEHDQIRYLRPQRSTLEEVFLNAVE
jgi:ABC-2 type transport system ATP-binding protein